MPPECISDFCHHWFNNSGSREHSPSGYITFKRDHVNTLRPRQQGRHFPDNIFKCILLNENVWISIRISVKFVPKVLINNTPSLVEIMAWCRSGDKPFSQPMMVSLLTHICVTRPQWVKQSRSGEYISVIILGMGSDNERSYYIGKPHLIGWAHTQNDPGYICLWTGSSLVQVVLCRLFGTKPLWKQCWFTVNWIRWKLGEKSSMKYC